MSEEQYSEAPRRRESEDEETSFLSHLVELRGRLMRILLCVAVVFACLFPFSETLYTWLSGPLLVHLPEGTSMIAIEVASPFLIPFKLTLMVAIFLAIPYILYQAWAFVAPGLYRHEKRIARPLLFAATILFYVGCLFAYFVVMPIVFGFITKVAPSGVEVMTDINRYLDFVLVMFLAFGLSFEVPVVTVVLVAMGVALVKGMSLRDVIDGFVSGCKGVTIGAIVLALAVTIQEVTSALGTADYVVATLGDVIPAVVLPAAFLVLCMLTAFSTGTSWGTYAVIFPVALPLAWAVAPDVGFLTLCFGSVVGGSVFGDQCSPISDTTILSSLSTGTDLMDHVYTQLPMALAAAGVAAVAYTVLAAFMV